MDADKIQKLALLLSERIDAIQAKKVVKFPRAKKRGPKVKIGPRAEILAFPGAPLTESELVCRWAWLFANRGRWDNEVCDGETDDNNIRFAQDIHDARVHNHGSDAETRKDVEKWTMEVEKRVAVKDWLESLGIEWNKAMTAEDALFWVFHRMAKPDLQPSA